MLASPEIRVSVHGASLGQNSKRNGLLRCEEVYKRDSPIFTTGLTRVGNLPHKQRFYVVSVYSLQYFLPFLEQIDSAKGPPLIFLQSVLSPLLANASISRNYRKHLRTFLIDSANAPETRYIYLNELRNGYTKAEPLLGTLLHLRHVLDVDITLLCCHGMSDDIDGTIVDPWHALASEAGLPIATLPELIREQHLCEKQEHLQIAYDECNAAIPVTGVGFTRNNAVDPDVVNNTPYISYNSAIAGVKKGTLHRGVITLSKYNNSFSNGIRKIQGIVQLDTQDDKIGRSVLIEGDKGVNRALSGDVVAVELLGTNGAFADDNSLAFAPHALDAEDVEQVIQEKSLSSSLGREILPLARVVGILCRKTEEIMARFPIKKEYETVSSSTNNRMEAVLLTPLNDHFPRIRVRTRRATQLQGQLVKVRLDPFEPWSITSLYPTGHVTEVLGGADNWRAHVKALLLSKGVHTSNAFGIAALGCLPTLATPSVPISPLRPEEWRKCSGHTTTPHLDLRKYPIFSVDPQGCQDIDDTMHIRWHPTLPGTLQLVIAIADVSSFVRYGTALDAEARARGTTVYLPHERLDMLPALLSANICSLHAGVDRQAVVLQWHITVTHAESGVPIDNKKVKMNGLELCDLQKSGKILFTVGPLVLSECGRALIRSRAALTYEQGDSLLKNESPTPAASFKAGNEGVAGAQVDYNLHEPLREQLHILTAFTRSLRYDRSVGRGHAVQPALDIAHGTEVKFEVGNDGVPSGMNESNHIEIHDTIAELMILSNTSVAKLLHDRQPRTALLRVHQPANAAKLHEVQDLLGRSEKKDIDGSTVLRNVQSETEKRIAEGTLSDEGAQLVSSTVIRGMQEAFYLPGAAVDANASTISGSGLVHTGLGLAYYTHFTSPIRRYADLVVHRQLLHVLSLKSASEESNNKDMTTDMISGGIKAPADNAASVLSRNIPQQEFYTSDDSNDDASDLSDLDALLDGVGEDLEATALTVNATVTVQNNEECKQTNFETTTSHEADEKKAQDKDVMEVQESTAQISLLTSHLNSRNRAAREVSRQCQELFLRIYLSNLPAQRVTAVIYSLRDNGFLALVPAYDVRLPVYLTNKHGVVTLTDKCIHRGNDDTTLRERPDLYLEYMQGGIGNSDEELLRISQAQNKSVPILQLRKLQAVNALLSCERTIEGELPSLKLAIIDAIFEEKTGNYSDAYDLKTAVREVTTPCAGRGTNTRKLADKNETIPPHRLPFVDLVKVFHPSNRRNLPILAHASTDTKGRSILRSPDTYRVSVAGGGRLCFTGKVPVSSDIVPITFKQTAQQAYMNGIASNKYSRNSLVTSEERTNIERAKARMAAYGEEWAEEVDLEGIWTPPDPTGGTDPSQLTGGISARDVRLASSRVEKVKTAKRNAKFK
jgi:exoribonuclease R